MGKKNKVKKRASLATELAAEAVDVLTDGQQKRQARKAKKRRMLEGDSDESKSRALHPSISAKIFEQSQRLLDEDEEEEQEEERAERKTPLSAGLKEESLVSEKFLTDDDELAQLFSSVSGFSKAEADEALQEEVPRRPRPPAETMVKRGGARGLMFDSDEPVSLVDAILAKIEEYETAQEDPTGETQQEKAMTAVERRLNAKVFAAFTGLGKMLHVYKSGKLPKIAVMLPRVANWEELLFITRPESWSQHAVDAMTRVFARSCDSDRIVEKFYEFVLLERVREEVLSQQRVPIHVYDALRRAIYRPGPFYKGIVLPLVLNGDANARECLIIGSIITKHSIPVLHSSAALMKIADMPYSTSVSHFIMTILDKQYSLPYVVIDAVYSHFVSFAQDERRMPLIWHKSLLVFAQRYKTELEPEQKTALKLLMRRQEHKAIRREVLRELFSSHCRNGAPVAADDQAELMEAMKHARFEQAKKKREQSMEQ
jgi:essential nuclear protein 1